MVYCRQCPACAEQERRGFLKPRYAVIQPHPVVKLAAMHCTNCGRYYIAGKKINWIRVVAFLGVFFLLFVAAFISVVFPGIDFLTMGFAWTITFWICMILAVFVDYAVSIRFKWTEASELDAKIQENRGINVWGPVVFAFMAAYAVPMIIKLILSLIVNA